MNTSEHQSSQKKQKSTIRTLIYRLLFLIALGIFLYSGYQLFNIYKANWDEKKEINEITEIAQIPETIEEIEDPDTPFEVNWEELRKVNSSVAGWIIIPDTDISYPIVQASDNEYYLNKTFANRTNYAGAIFIDYRNKADFSENNTFIYGHNVKHGTMFAELANFMNQSFFDQHPYVYLFTPEGNYRCEVLSFQSTYDGSDAYQMGITNEEAWSNYIDIITAPDLKGHIRTETVMEEGDRMITLSTCSYEVNNELSDRRYLLHAKLVPWDGTYQE